MRIQLLCMFMIVLLFLSSCMMTDRDQKEVSVGLEDAFVPKENNASSDLSASPLVIVSDNLEDGI